VAEPFATDTKNPTNLAFTSFLEVSRPLFCRFKNLLLIWHIEIRFAIIKTLRMSKRDRQVSKDGRLTLQALIPCPHRLLG
jgi:hypothetical protein